MESVTDSVMASLGSRTLRTPTSAAASRSLPRCLIDPFGFACRPQADT